MLAKFGGKWKATESMVLLSWSMKAEIWLLAEDEKVVKKENDSPSRACKTSEIEVQAPVEEKDVSVSADRVGLVKALEGTDGPRFPV